MFDVLSLAAAMLATSPIARSSDFAVASAQSIGGCRRNGGSSENSHQRRDGELPRWRAHWSGTDCSVDIRATGEMLFNPDFTDILGFSRGGQIEITEIRGGTVRRAILRDEESGRFVRSWSVNGREQPWDDVARRWIADFLIELDRHTGMGVNYRFPVLLAQGGAAAVIAEVELMQSDYVRGIYLRRLIASATLTDAEYERLVSVAAREMSSDYEMARVLLAVADKASLDNDGMRSSYLRGVERMSSDYERSRVLQAVVSKSSTSTSVGAAAIKTAASLRSDYERSRVLLAAIANKSLAATDAIPILETVTRSSSDYEKARVMLAVVARWPLTGDARKAYLRAADTIRSDHENRRVLSALVNQEAR